MLLGNCTSGVSLGLTTILEELTTRRDSIGERGHEWGHDQMMGKYGGGVLLTTDRKMKHLPAVVGITYELSQLNISSY